MANNTRLINVNKFLRWFFLTIVPLTLSLLLSTQLRWNITSYMDSMKLLYCQAKFTVAPRITKNFISRTFVINFLIFPYKTFSFICFIHCHIISASEMRICNFAQTFSMRIHFTSPKKNTLFNIYTVKNMSINVIKSLISTKKFTYKHFYWKN